jgi:hypothetical protein
MRRPLGDKNSSTLLFDFVSSLLSFALFTNFSANSEGKNSVRLIYYRKCNNLDLQKLIALGNNIWKLLPSSSYRDI